MVNRSCTTSIEQGQGPDLVYLPELIFDYDRFFSDVERILKEKSKVIVAISEGVKDAEGKYIPEHFSELSTDSFGHAQLGGTAQILADQVKEKLNVKVRAIEFSLMQRCAAHLASKVDVREAFHAGVKGVREALKGTTDKMIGFKRLSSTPYKMKYVLVPLSVTANTERKVPLEWILPDNTGLTKDFVEYALPLIQGEDKAPLENGLPRFAKLKKIRVPKK